MTTWTIKNSTGSVSQRHLTIPTFDMRQIIFHTVDKPTMVFGTAQKNITKEINLNCEFVRRKSGGGAVFLEPEGVLWVDFVIPKSDHLWENDIGRSSLWLGELWAKALKEIGIEGKVHRDGLLKNRFSSQVCFAGLATGEVSVLGKKSIGISQRRTSEGAWFQCAALFSWPIEKIVDMLQLKPREKAIEDLLHLAAPIECNSEELATALLKQVF